MRLTIQARLPDQAMTGRFDYWEGRYPSRGCKRRRLSGDDGLLSLTPFAIADEQVRLMDVSIGARLAMLLAAFSLSQADRAAVQAMASMA